MPRTKNIKIIMIVKNIEYFFDNVKKDSGNNSITDMPIIITAVNERQKVINLSIFLILKNITKPPITVERPAIVEISKAFIICIISPINYMTKISKKSHINEI